MTIYMDLSLLLLAFASIPYVVYGNAIDTSIKESNSITIKKESSHSKRELPTQVEPLKSTVADASGIIIENLNNLLEKRSANNLEKESGAGKIGRQRRMLRRGSKGSVELRRSHGRNRNPSHRHGMIERPQTVYAELNLPKSSNRIRPSDSSDVEYAELDFIKSGSRDPEVIRELNKKTFNDDSSSRGGFIAPDFERMRKEYVPKPSDQEADWMTSEEVARLRDEMQNKRREMDPAETSFAERRAKIGGLLKKPNHPRGRGKM